MLLSLTSTLFNSSLILAKELTPPIVIDTYSTITSIVSPEQVINYVYGLVLHPITTSKNTVKVIKTIAMSILMVKVIAIVNIDINPLT